MVCRIDHLARIARIPTFEPVWYLVDAENQILDKFAIEMARILIGRARPTFSHYQNLGDYLVVINTDRIVYPEKSWSGNFYRTYTGLPKGEKFRSAGYFHTRDRTFILYMEINFILRKTPYRNDMLKKLFLFPDSNHPFVEKSLIPLDTSKFNGINNNYRVSDLTPEILKQYPKLILKPIKKTSTQMINEIKCKF